MPNPDPTVFRMCKRTVRAAFVRWHCRQPNESESELIDTAAQAHVDGLCAESFCRAKETEARKKAAREVIERAKAKFVAALTALGLRSKISPPPVPARILTPSRN